MLTGLGVSLHSHVPTLGQFYDLPALQALVSLLQPATHLMGPLYARLTYDAGKLFMY